MPKIAVRIALVLAGLLALLLAAGAIVAARFDPNDYKPQLVRLVQEKKDRTLAIPGDIRLRFFPRLAADLGKVSLSEYRSGDEFASVDSLRLSLALLPLLSKRFVVDELRIDGLRANLRRAKDGTTNIDDLLQDDPAHPPADAQAPPQAVGFDIDGVRIGNAQIRIDDRQQDRRIELRNLQLETGRIADGAPSRMQMSADVAADKPALDARLVLGTGFTLESGQGRMLLKGVDAALKGSVAGFDGASVSVAGDADLRPGARRFALERLRIAMAGKRDGQAIDATLELPQLAVTDAQVSGGKLKGEARLQQGTRTVSAALDAPSFEGSPQAFRLPAMTLDASIRDAGLDAKARLSGALTGDIDAMRFASPGLSLALSGSRDGAAIGGTLGSPLSVDLGAKLVTLSKIAGKLTLPNPAGGTLAVGTAGDARFDTGRGTLAATLKGSIDDSAYDARLGMTTASPAAYTFDIGIDRFDLDRYRAKPAVAPAAPGSSPAKPAAPEKPLDLSMLDTLRADGSLRIGTLKAAGIRASNVRLGVKAAKGRLDLDPLAANLYGGSAAGALSVTAGKVPRVALRQNLTGIDVGPLLRDVAGSNRIDGKGNVRLDVSGSGATVEAIRRALNGSAALELRDGSIRGVNIAQVLRSAKARLGELRGDAPPQAGTGSAAERTDFSELAGTFRIVNGVARNDDLLVKSPLIRVAGAGDIDIGAARIDYLARATIVSTLQGQGGPELQALKGVTVPVRLSGPFDAVGWRIDVAGMASELAKQKLDEKKDEARAAARQAIDEQKGKVQERVKEGLRGLFGR